MCMEFSLAPDIITRLAVQFWDRTKLKPIHRIYKDPNNKGCCLLTAAVINILNETIQVSPPYGAFWSEFLYRTLTGDQSPFEHHNKEAMDWILGFMTGFDGQMAGSNSGTYANGWKYGVKSLQAFRPVTYRELP